MKKNIIMTVCALILVTVFGISGCSSFKESSDVEKSMRNNSAAEDFDIIKIGIALYSIQNEYTIRFADAVQEQAEQIGIEVQLYDGNYDASRQNAQVEEMIEKGMDGILLIPQDAEECVEAVELAEKAGIPIVSVNTRVNSDKISSYVGSNDTEAGELVTESVVKALNGAGNVVILEGPMGQSAQVERLEGIKNILKKYPQLQVIGKKTANWSRLEAKSVMKKWLQTFDQIDAVIAENDDMALGALDAIAETEREICVVGIDGSREGLQAVKDGNMYMTVFQDAENQSRTALEVIVKCVEGQPVDENYWIPLKEIVTE